MKARVVGSLDGGRFYRLNRSPFHARRPRGGPPIRPGGAPDVAACLGSSAAPEQPKKRECDCGDKNGDTGEKRASATCAVVRH
jgi:hypothetical protein